MPDGINWGNYLANGTRGDQVSSTYEGRYVTCTAAELLTASGSGVATKGYPCVFGLVGLQGVGICMNTGTLTDLISIDTEGIWDVQVVATDAIQNSLVSGGDQLYISVDGGIITKNNDGATQIPFGIALGSVPAGDTEVIPVKVHQNSSLDCEQRTYFTVTDGAYGKHHTAIYTGGASTGLEYFDQRITGVQTGGVYGFSTWMELAVAFTPTDDLLVAHEIGIYDVGCGLAANGRVVMQQMQAILAETPATSFHWFRLNLAAAGGTATAIFASANPESVGFVIDVADNAGANKIGNVPLFDIVGHGIGFVEVFSA